MTGGGPDLDGAQLELVEGWVAQAGSRGQGVRAVLAALGIAPSSYYRARERRRRAAAGLAMADRRGSAYELLPEERMLICDFALAWPDLRHRVLAAELTDAGLVCASAASIYRVLKEQGLVAGWKQARAVGRRYDRAKAPDERWAVDLTYLRVLGRWQYLLYVMDEYSRYVVHHELLWTMGRYAVTDGLARALDKPGRVREPEIQSDNGPAFISGEFRRHLAHRGLVQRRIHPHCPEENGIVERGIRTLKEIAGSDYPDGDVEERVGRGVDYYNHERRHSALEYLRPIDYYRGDPQRLLAERKAKVAQARQHRRAMNRQLRRAAAVGSAMGVSPV